MANAVYQEDLSLVTRALQGDVRAREEIFQRLAGRIRTMARHLSPDCQQAEDAAQDVAVQVLRGLKNYRGEARLEAWADGVALRTLRKRLRSHRTRRREVSWDLSSWPSRNQDPEHQASRRELAERLARAVAELPDILAEALVLKLVLGHSVAEAAGIAGVRENTFRDRLRRARRALRQAVLADPGLAGGLLGSEGSGYPRGSKDHDRM